MPDVGELVAHWGYVAIFLFVILGNVGLPVPEETILVLSGYLVWQRDLRLSLVLVVGILSAMAGDNLGYWIGRRFGQETIERYGHWIMVTAERLEATRRFVSRFGAFGVFAARFVVGLRFLAGPVAGSTGLRPASFVVANVLGAITYVPMMVGAGYAIGYGLGDSVRRFEQVAGRIERVVLFAAVLLTLLFLAQRALRTYRARKDS